jgi:hypothetical protein
MLRIYYIIKNYLHQNINLKALSRTSRIYFGLGCSESRCKHESQSSHDQRNWKLLKWYANHQTKRSKTVAAILSIRRNRISVA